MKKRVPLALFIETFDTNSNYINIPKAVMQSYYGYVAMEQGIALKEMGMFSDTNFPK